MLRQFTQRDSKRAFFVPEKGEPLAHLRMFTSALQHRKA